MLATILQVAGASAITVGVALMFIPAGLIIGGAFAILFGLAIERRV